jgi:ribokinase
MMMTGSGATGRVLIVGASNTDLVCQTDRLPLPGETVASTSFAIHAGGKGANQAVAAARSGAEVSFVGCFGDDDYGVDRERELDAEGIDLDHTVSIQGEPSGLALIAVDAAGENLIITVGGANDRLTVEQVNACIKATDPDIVLLPNEAPPEVVRRTVEMRSANRLMILNAAPFADHLRDLLNDIDCLICNEIEAAQFLDQEVTSASADTDVHSLAQSTRRGAIITLGADGAVGVWDDEMQRLPAHPVEVVDTTGCGDAFCGAFAAWIARGEGFRSSLAAGIAAGALAATVSGAQPSLPYETDIRKRMASSD